MFSYFIKLLLFSSLGFSSDSVLGTVLGAYDGFMGYLSQAAYYVHGKGTCPEFNALNVADQFRGIKKECRKYQTPNGDLQDFGSGLYESAENAFFAHTAFKSLVLQECSALDAHIIAKKFSGLATATSGQSVKYGNFLLDKEEFRIIGAIKEIRRASKKIKSMRVGGTDPCRIGFSRGDGATAAGPITSAGSAKVCQEYSVTQLARSMIYSSIPHADMEPLKTLLLKFEENPDDNFFENNVLSIKSQLSLAYIAVSKNLSESAKELSQTLRTKGGAGLDRAARIDLFNSSGFSRIIEDDRSFYMGVEPRLKSNKKLADNFQEQKKLIQCLDAKYGSGAKLMQGDLFKLGVITWIGTGLLVKAGGKLAEIGYGLSVAKSVGAISIKASRYLSVAAFAVDGVSIVDSTMRACSFRPKTIQTPLATSNSKCEKVDYAQENCFLETALNLMGYASDAANLGFKAGKTMMAGVAADAAHVHAAQTESIVRPSQTLDPKPIFTDPSPTNPKSPSEVGGIETPRDGPVNSTSSNELSSSIASRPIDEKFETPETPHYPPESKIDDLEKYVGTHRAFDCGTESCNRFLITQEGLKHIDAHILDDFGDWEDKIRKIPTTVTTKKSMKFALHEIQNPSPGTLIKKTNDQRTVRYLTDETGKPLLSNDNPPLQFRLNKNEDLAAFLQRMSKEGKPVSCGSKCGIESYTTQTYQLTFENPKGGKKRMFEFSKCEIGKCLGDPGSGDKIDPMDKVITMFMTCGPEALVIPSIKEIKKNKYLKPTIKKCD
jgi:hypothetical protein